MTGGTDEELISGLTEAQRAAVLSEAAPLCIVAAAGAGKTRVLTRRIAWRCRTGRADAEHTLALTFTRRAAGELQHRLGGLGLRGGVAAGTFHAHAAAQLQRWWADRRQTAPTLVDRKSRLLAPIVAERTALGAGASTGAGLAEVAGVIEWAKARTIAPEDFERVVTDTGRGLPAGMTATALAAVYRRYEDEKRRRGLIDFDDLLGRCADALERDPEFAGAQRWRWRHVYVDEFQDLNPLQHRLLLAWLGSSRDLCVVGDPNQAIYGWNGADPRLLAEFPARWPGAEVLHLDANHRCTEPIVRAAAAVLGPDGERLTAAGRTGPIPVVSGSESDRTEAGAIAIRLVAAHRAGRPWSQMAVLTRTNAQLGAIQHALTAAGVPCWSAASAALLDDPAARARLSSLKVEGRRPLRVVLADLAEEVADGATEPNQVLLESGRAYAALRPDASAAEWLAWLPAAGRDRTDRSAPSEAVTLSSFHRAKGLEWPLVWVAGVEEGLVPMGRPASGAVAQEERQLLYVALTRAVDELYVSWAATRYFGTRPVPRTPSRWLPAVEQACSELVGRETGPDDRDGGEGHDSDRRARWAGQRASLAIEAARRRVGRPRPPGWPEPDEAVRAALQAWRLETARHGGVTPNAVLHDATLDALASLRPASMEDLLGVPGIGAVKAGRYGPVILDILGERAQAG